MSRVSLVATKFVNVKSGEESFGYRLYDDYDSVYNNMWNFIPDNDLDFLELALEDGHGMFDFLQENELGIDINGTWYDWNEIEHLFKDN